GQRPEPRNACSLSSRSRRFRRQSCRHRPRVHTTFEVRLWPILWGRRSWTLIIISFFQYRSPGGAKRTPGIAESGPQGDNDGIQGVLKPPRVSLRSTRLRTLPGSGARRSLGLRRRLSQQAHQVAHGGDLFERGYRSDHFLDLTFGESRLAVGSQLRLDLRWG